MGGEWEFYRGSTKVPPRFYQLSSNPGQVGGTCEISEVGEAGEKSEVGE